MTSTTPKPQVTRLLPWFIWGLGALFYGYEFFLQVSPSVMVPELMHTFRLDAAGVGALSGMYYYSYSIMQIPAGMFLDTLGPKRLLTAACAICALGALLFGASHTLLMARLGRLLIGFGSAFAVIGTFKLAANWFPLERFALITGLTVTMGMTGAVVGGAPLAILVEHLGWRGGIILLAIIGLFLSLSIWLAVRDKPTAIEASAAGSNPQIHEKVNRSHILNNLFTILKQRQSWITAIYGGLMFAPTTAFAALWGVSFLMTRYGVHRAIAASAISMIFIGWIVGSPLFGWIADYIRQRKPTLYIGTIGAFISMCLIIYMQMPLHMMYVLLFIFGFSSAGFLPTFSIIREINPANTSATALGFMNTLNMVGGAVLQPLIGWFLDRHWHGQMADGVRIFSIGSYYTSLMVLPIILLIALFMIPFIKETYCKQTG